MGCSPPRARRSLAGTAPASSHHSTTSLLQPRLPPGPPALVKSRCPAGRNPRDPFGSAPYRVAASLFIPLQVQNDLQQPGTEQRGGAGWAPPLVLCNLESLMDQGSSRLCPSDNVSPTRNGAVSRVPGWWQLQLLRAWGAAWAYGSDPLKLSGKFGVLFS